MNRDVDGRDREMLARVFYGEGATPSPWATDCPVEFDVWLSYATPGKGRRGRRVDVIVAVNEEHGVPRVLARLQKVADARPIAAGNFIVAKLTLAELVQIVLPMTNLYVVIRSAQQLGPQLEGFVKAPATSGEAAALPQEPERRREQSEHLRWFLGLVRAVISPASGARREAAVARLIADTELEPQLTRPPGGGDVPLIDRRRRYPVTSVTLNRSASHAVMRSRATVKADAAEQLFAVDCSRLGWAVIDSGIDAAHPAFADWGMNPDTVGATPPTRVVRAFDFVGARDSIAGDVFPNGLIDWPRGLPYVEIQLPGAPVEPGAPLPRIGYTPPVDDHGTHVAGILGGHWPVQGLRGICPTIRLYDFRVLSADGKGDEFSIVTALQAIRYINELAGRLVIAGVNLSLAVPYHVAAHSCGWTPVCVECDRLVRSGVVVVAAAGNAGFTGPVRTTGVGFHAVSIADPGNTDAVITVGSTHATDPHRNGVSYFSSRGPTADGRSKPDLLAPGEDIDGPVTGQGIAAMFGTSQAAAHVSGAAAMLIARYRELLGRPDRVKAILIATATDLGREPAFQGAGLVDVLRAMQSI